MKPEMENSRRTLYRLVVNHTRHHPEPFELRCTPLPSGKGRVVCSKCGNLDGNADLRERIIAVA